MANWKPGDLVMLKSGGPEMTVELVEEKLKQIKCIWFEGFKRNEGTFHPDALETPEE